MWLLAVTVLVVASARHRAEATTLCRRAVARVLGRARGTACARSTHAFVFSGCTHGKADSVLATFDLYAETNHTQCLGPRGGVLLDEVVRRRVLELGTHCGYSAIRILRLLPPAGRLLTVEIDPETSELGEELILVAGFKPDQFQIFTCSSAAAIAALRLHAGPGSRPDVDLVLMDHDRRQYLPDLLALEREGLLCPSGCWVLLVNRDRKTEEGLEEVLEARAESYSTRTDQGCMVQVFYHRAGWSSPVDPY